jgi:hypothetical protein
MNEEIVSNRKRAVVGGGVDSPSKNWSEQETGIFHIPQSELFSTNKFVVWREMFGFGFSIICEEDENRQLASLFLHFFPKVLIDTFKAPQLTTDIVSYITLHTL